MHTTLIMYRVCPFVPTSSTNISSIIQEYCENMLTLIGTCNACYSLETRQETSLNIGKWDIVGEMHKSAISILNTEAESWVKE